MSMYQGNLEGFLHFVGPLTRNVVCNLSRTHKKGKSCQGVKADGSRCCKRTGLEAAHISGQERPKIIADLLIPTKIGENEYAVNLADFEADFRRAHENLSDVIIPLCKPCHRKYDAEHNIKEEISIPFGEHALSDQELAVLENNELEFVRDIVTISLSQKGSVMDKVRLGYPGITGKNSSYARLSHANGLWNFDVDKVKFQHDFYFIFYNQHQDDFRVAKIPARNFELSKHPTKSNGAARFFFYQDDISLMEKTIGNISRFLF